MAQDTHRMHPARPSVKVPCSIQVRRFTKEALGCFPKMPEAMARSDLLRVERAAQKAAEARAELRQAIMLARASGETHADIARAAGLTRQRIAQIVKGE